jgi:hypothetical protein
MDVFDSREGDPLLQDDPFGPSGEEKNTSNASSQSPAASEQTEEPDGVSSRCCTRINAL